MFIGIEMFARAAAAATSPPTVLVSIKPVHALVAGVMQDIAQPGLLIEAGASPHVYSLRPSAARALEQADVVFWVGRDLEAFLQKPLAALPKAARVVALHEAPGVRLLPYRAEQHPEHDNEVHEREHLHDDAHDAADHHHAGRTDMHIWLDPINAEAMVTAITATLVEVDSAQERRYRANADAVVARLHALDTELSEALAPVKNRPFVVFHDAYRYLEDRYGLAHAGAIALNPERAPGARHLREIRQRIEESGALCVFNEPQFEPAVLRTVIEGTRAGTGVLDAEGGVGIPAGPDAYFTMMRRLAASLTDCLGAAD